MLRPALLLFMLGFVSSCIIIVIIPEPQTTTTAANTAARTTTAGILEVSTKTGDDQYNGSDAEAILEVCDETNSCCTTTGGLDHPNGYRQQGKLDTFSRAEFLGSCFEKPITGIPSVKISTYGRDKTDGWFVDWIKIKTSSNIFKCTIGGYVDHPPGEAGPPSRSAKCIDMAHSIIGVATKTGDDQYNGSDAEALLEVCDESNSCCTTAGGLDHPSGYRQQGIMDTFSRAQFLGSCFEKPIIGIPSVKISTYGRDKTDGWFVDWIIIKTSSNVYKCKIGGYVDHPPGQAGPPSRSAKCIDMAAITEVSTKAGEPETTTTTATTTIAATTTTTATNTTVATSRSASNTTTAAASTTAATTMAAAGQRKKRSTEDCFQLEVLEQMAFQYCPHAVDGFTWAEVEDCEAYVGDISVPFVMPTKENFDNMDSNVDGVLTMEEWVQFVGCVDQ